LDHIHAICLSSLLAVINAEDENSDDQEYQTRRILRWYSREFHTPLHVVSTLPLDDVFQAFFETHFEGLSSKKRIAKAAKLTATPEEVKAEAQAALEASIADEAFEEIVAERNKASGAKLEPLKERSEMSLPLLKGDSGDDIEMVFEGDNLPTKGP